MTTPDSPLPSTAPDCATAARCCRFCGAVLPPASPRGGMPAIRCKARICQLKHGAERRLRCNLRRWLLLAERRGDAAAVERFRLRLDKLT